MHILLNATLFVKLINVQFITLSFTLLLKLSKRYLFIWEHNVWFFETDVIVVWVLLF